MTKVYAYIRPQTERTPKSELTRQRAAINAIAGLLGLTISENGWGEEAFSSHDAVLQTFVQRLGLNDVLIVSQPSTLSTRPMKLLEIAGILAGKGVRLVVADQPGGSLNLESFRASLEPLLALETENNALRAELTRKQAEHDAEFEIFAKQYEEQIMGALQKRGVRLGALLRPDNSDIPAAIDRPDEGRKLKEIRERLGMSQEQAGKLVEPPLNKGTVSRIESTGSAAPSYAEYAAAIDTAGILAAAAERKRLKEIEAAPTRATEASRTLKKALDNETAALPLAS